MKANKTLGRSITDLIEENNTFVKENEEVLDIKIVMIKPNPEQPRVNFDHSSLKELANSIKEHGVLQPVIVKPSNNGYTLVAGERRVRASKIAGRLTVPAIVRDYNSIYLTELAIMENLHREDLTPIEEAIAYEKAIKNLGLTQSELGKKIGKSRSYITNMIGLLNLPMSVIEDVNNGKISMGHARVLSKLQNTNTITNLAQKIKDQGITVRKTEELAKTIEKKNKIIRKTETTNHNQLMVEAYLKKKLNSDFIVEIKNKHLVLKFSSNADFNKFIKKIDVDS